MTVVVKLTKLEEINLEGNLLTSLPMFDSEGVVQFSGNPLICDARLIWMFNQNIPGQFVAPDSLKTINLQTLTYDDIQVYRGRVTFA